MNKKFIDFPKQINILYTKEKNKIREIPKIIWLYWDNPELPKSIKSFINNIQKLNPDHKINVLNSQNLNNYLPNFKIKGNMRLANKTDLIRLELLFNFGGIWIDATIIFKKNIKWIYSISKNSSYDIIGYYREVSTIDFRYPIIESWFLAAYPKNEFVGKWLEVLQPLGEIGSEEYFKKLCKRSDYLKIKQLIDPPEYLLVYLACQIAQRESPNFTYYLRKAEDSAFYLHEKLFWNRAKINYMLNRIPYKHQNFELIKLTGAERKLLDKFEKYNLIKSNSLIGKLYNNILN